MGLIFRCRWAIAAILSLFWPLAHGQSLSEAIRIALSQYPSIIAAQARLNASRADIIRAEGQHYPQISWQGTSSNYSGVNSVGGATASGILPDNTWIQSPRVTLNIWAGGRIQAGVDRAKSISTARLHQQRLTRDEVALFAFEAYMNWARSMEMLRLAQANVQAHENILNDVKKITQVDQGRMIDQRQVEVRLQSASVSLQRRRAELEAATQRLERMLLGTMPAKPTGLDDIRGVIPATVEQAVATVNDQHPAIAVQMAQIDAARAQVASARSEYSPTVNLSYGKQTTQGSGQGDYITQININVPIFSGGSTYGAVGSASNELIAAEQGLTEARLTLTEQILSIWPQLSSTRTRKALSERQVVTSRTLVRGYEQQFRIGQRSLLDLLTVQRELYDYQNSAVIAAFDERVAKGRMIAAIGQLAHAYSTAAATTTANATTSP